MFENSMFPVIQLDEQTQSGIVAKCNAFKTNVQQNGREKKDAMRRCYAYSKSKFYGDDLLPRPAVLGEERDINKNRSQIFIPVVRQQLKILFSFLKLTLFPNDEDFFRIRAKTDEVLESEQEQYQQILEMSIQTGMMPPSPNDLLRYTDVEEDLTEAVKYIFKKNKITEKFGEALWDACWSGIGVLSPTVERPIYWEWDIDPNEQAFMPRIIEGEPRINLDAWNPINFWMDPNARSGEPSKWGYFTIKKKQELMDAPYVLNKDQLVKLESKTINTNQAAGQLGALDLSSFNSLENTFTDVEDSVYYDVFYFPYLKLDDGREFRNMIFGVANSQVLVEAKPNLFPKGLPPVEMITWMNDKESPYGTGPAEDMADLQKLINIIYNYMVEQFARIGNRFITRPEVDMSQFWGIAGGIATAENPSTDVVAISGDYIETVHLSNMLGVLKAEANTVAGASNPFQGSSNVDFKKTATEIQLLQENSVSVSREIIEHVSVGVQRVLDMLLHLIAEVYTEPIKIRVDGAQTGTRYVEVPMQLLRTGNFEIELVSTNPSQSKNAQVEGLLRFAEMAMKDPGALEVMEPLWQKIGALWGIKDANSLIGEIKERFERVQQSILTQQQGIQGAEGGLPPEINQGME